MFQSPPPKRPTTIHTLSVRLGAWFEAHATGGGVAVVPLILVLVLGAVVVRAWLA